MHVDFVTEALRYRGLHWAVFPCAAGDKVPAIKGGHGCRDASTDESIIRLWGRNLPYANIGLACGEPSGGIVVVDIDPRHGGEQSIAALALKGRAFPAGPSSQTGNGGRHLFFRHDGKLANSKGKLGAGLDIRATGGYVVAPPSWLKPSENGPGGPYAWLISPFDAVIPRLPIWIAELLRPRPAQPYVPPKTMAEGKDRVDHLARFAAKAPPGQRNNAAFWAACRAAELALDGKVDPRVVMERLKIAGQMAGLPPDEVERTIASAMSRVLGRKGGA